MAGQIINNASQINTEADDLRSQINVTKIESMIKIAISDKKEKLKGSEIMSERYKIEDSNDLDGFINWCLDKLTNEKSRSGR